MPKKRIEPKRKYTRGKLTVGFLVAAFVFAWISQLPGTNPEGEAIFTIVASGFLLGFLVNCLRYYLGNSGYTKYGLLVGAWVCNTIHTWDMRFGRTVPTDEFVITWRLIAIVLLVLFVVSLVGARVWVGNGAVYHRKQGCSGAKKHIFLFSAKMKRLQPCARCHSIEGMGRNSG